MKPNKQQKRTKLTRLLMKIVLVAISSVLIVYFMPRGDEFGYSYELDKPWNYGLLIAKTKFPILKNDSTIRKEQETLKRKFQPYYNHDGEVRDSMVNRLYNQTADEWHGQNASMYVHHIAALLDTVYRHGVLSAEDYSRMLDEEHHKSIRIVKDNEAKAVPLSSVYNLRSAYKYIMYADTIKYSRLVMQQYNINELLLPNLTYDAVKSGAELEYQLKALSDYEGFIQAGPGNKKC